MSQPFHANKGPQQPQGFQTLSIPSNQTLAIPSKQVEDAVETKKYKKTMIIGMVCSILGTAGTIYAIKGDWIRIAVPNPSDGSAYYLYGPKHLTICNAANGCNASPLSGCDMIQKRAGIRYKDPDSQGSFCGIDSALPGILYTAAAFAGIAFLTCVYLAKEGHINTGRRLFQLAAVASAATVVFNVLAMCLGVGLITTPVLIKHDDFKPAPFVAFFTNVVSGVLFGVCAVFVWGRSKLQPVVGGADPNKPVGMYGQPGFYGQQPVQMMQYGQPQLYNPAVQQQQFVYPSAGVAGKDMQTGQVQYTTAAVAGSQYVMQGAQQQQFVTMPQQAVQTQAYVAPNPYVGQGQAYQMSPVQQYQQQQQPTYQSWK
ncbi:hypothetical protein HDU97_003710 [Phlyctochytrium planicorne]|nr:hypothetical protein HDU97_003710 [Phlyctochytrium planicorne]